MRNLINVITVTNVLNGLQSYKNTREFILVRDLLTVLIVKKGLQRSMSFNSTCGFTVLRNHTNVLDATVLLNGLIN